MKRVFLLALLAGCVLYLPAEESQPATTPEHRKNITWYTGINPLALIAFLPNGIGTAGTAMGVLSGQEFGISIYGGMHFAQAHSLEMRFSAGAADAVVWDTSIPSFFR